MKDYLLNYFISFVMIATAVITLTHDSLKGNLTLVIFAIIWFLVALIYSIMTTRSLLKSLQKKIDT